ncbi:hypothetical protein C7M52_00938 [Mixta theicola]|nr:glycosyltransferase [Mixta theicola]QHM74994.1 hypothetical protein C7M52_00938 [Mixta theicola]
MNKIFFIEPQFGKISGAQKVTLNVFKTLIHAGLSTTAVMPRANHSQIQAEYEKSGNDFLFYNMPKALGTGGFDGFSRYKKIFLFLCSLFSLAGFYAKMTFYVFRYKYTHIYTYDPRGLLLALPIAIISRRKLIWHLHGKFNYGNKIFNIVSKLCDAIIVPSNAIAADLKVKEKIYVVYNGFDFSNYTHATEKNKKDSLELIYVGLFTPQKGLHILLSSLGHLSTNINVNLTVVGDILDDNWIWYKDYINYLVSILPMNIHVIFEGWQQDVNKYIVDKDYFIFSSQLSGDILFNGKKYSFCGSEALPTVIIECLATGVPVIANRVPGVDEIIEPDNGYVAELHTVEQMTAMLGKLYYNEITFKLPINYERIRNKFSLQKMEKSIIDIVNIV